MKALPIDRAQSLMRTLGWSFGDVCYAQGQSHVWQVDALRDQDRIIARAHTQSAAWDEALRQAGIIQRDAEQ
jgi:hypothetical protein